MKSRSLLPLFSFLGLALVIISITQIAAEDPKDTSNATRVRQTNPADARRQAEILHDAFHATLQAIHHEYYRSDQGMTLPAAAMKSVFRELEERHKLEIRWLAVNAQAMNIEHQPQTEFEKKAAAALAKGDERIELIEGNLYRHAAAIVLQSECLKCHLPNRTSNKNRLAGLMISIPLQAEK